MGVSIKNILKDTVNNSGNLLLSPPLGGGTRLMKNHSNRTERKLALTFDDGPSYPSTSRLLDALDELNVKATFFMVGDNIAQNPELVKRAFEAGHVIASHSMNHSRKAGLQLTGGSHIDLASNQIKEIINCKPLLYRPPWGWLTPWEGLRLKKRGFVIVGWDVYTLDWVWPELSGKEIAEKAVRDTKPGSILLFHDGVPNTKEWDKKETVVAIRHMVPLLQSQGFQFVTIPELLNVAAYA